VFIISSTNHTVEGGNYGGRGVITTLCFCTIICYFALSHRQQRLPSPLPASIASRECSHHHYSQVLQLHTGNKLERCAGGPSWHCSVLAVAACLHHNHAADVTVAAASWCSPSLWLIVAVFVGFLIFYCGRSAVLPTFLAICHCCSLQCPWCYQWQYCCCLLLT